MLLQPYYSLDDEEDLLLGPDKEIWNTFEPLSSSHSSSATAWDLLDQKSPSSVYLQSFVIHDCMWSSSFAAADKLKKAVSHWQGDLQARHDSTSSTGDSASKCQSQVPQMKTSHTLDFLKTTRTCINPSEVLPYSTLHRRQDVTKGAGAGANICPSEPVEEEKGMPLSNVNIQQHYNAPPQPNRKQTQIRASDAHLASSQSILTPYCGKERRKNAKVIERQRRKELNRSFLALKAHVPDLVPGRRNPKAAILKRATEVITVVQADEKMFLARKEALMARMWELKHRLKQLAS
ncbi:transcriptional regulator Myc-1-like isoform X2 [Nerophis ophidion]|uniref:transcriptional regulator Myc-1-like isoform X2 n=1 Tax=Nerophis ophidion TaxID=159077 RepID=UPI002AE02335|nr:transcriptional regulator Myc-1-like isoform X2 [Nerophis ophidion]